MILQGSPVGRVKGGERQQEIVWDETGVGLQHPIQCGALGVTTFRGWGG